MSVEPASRLRVVLCWHMHQPQYQDVASGVYTQPWTYLHAIKDYVDMAAHLEAVPGARAVVNFAPILLEQIDDYARQVNGFLAGAEALRDPVLQALADPSAAVGAAQRARIIRACLRANEQRLINRFPAYRRLADVVARLNHEADALDYLNDQFLADILVWYHLAWLGETVRRGDTRVKRLQDKGRSFSSEDRFELIALVGELLGGILPRYKALADAGRIELSMTPYAHPIMPLLLDVQAAREAMPDVPLPSRHFPGGSERVQWHLQEGLQVFERYFERRPTGCWPSEGGISATTLQLLDDCGFRWAASGEQVLRNSLSASDAVRGLPKERGLHRPFKLEGKGPFCFFRDDGLSDLIGFTYADWHADDAVANLVHHLENIERACHGDRDSVVSIVLDGENAWEYYPNNGYYFLRALYERLANHTKLQLCTFSEALDAGVNAPVLPQLVAGSWVYGTFSTWIGDKDKNRGWEMLIEAKAHFDAAMASGRLSREQSARAVRQMAICEGSDWFWWFGDYNPSATVSEFDRLFREHLASLYRLLGEPPPEYLSHAFSHGGGHPQLGGVMRRGQAQPS